MNRPGRYRFAFLLTACAFAAAAICYAGLPERIPVHWDLHGAVNGWLPKRIGAFALPLTCLVVIGLLIAAAPKAVEDGDSYPMLRVYPRIVASVAAFLLCLTLLVLGLAMGVNLSAPTTICISLGTLFIVIGNDLGKITPNRIVGIRTPWTLANDEVWYRTHRLGGWLFVLAGVGVVVAGLLGSGIAIALGAVMTIAAVSAASSYVFSRRFDQDTKSGPR